MACGKNGGEEISTIIPKDQMTEEDIKLNFITPALVSRGWQNKITKFVIRSLRKSETGLLKDFLYEAISIPSGMESSARDIIEKPELRVYVSYKARLDGAMNRK